LSAGNPDRSLLEIRLDKEDIVLGQWQQIDFPRPYHIGKNSDHAIQLGSPDAGHKIAIAEIGKRDHAAAQIVTEQADGGVLMLSPNDVTWTAIPEKDMTLQIIARQYTANELIIPAGTLTLDGETHLACVAPVEQPEGTVVAFRLTRADGSAFWMQDGSSVELGEAYTGDLTVEAVLRGDETVSPIWTPQVTFVKGKRQASGDYVTRAMTAGTNVRIRIIYESNSVNGSSVVAEVLAGASVLETTLISATPAASGFYEYVHEVTGVTETLVRGKLTLANEVDRPIAVRKPQIVVTAV
jgi:hypothetical protein